MEKFLRGFKIGVPPEVLFQGNRGIFAEEKDAATNSA